MINYPIQRSISASDMPALPNGNQYFIVGATNGNAADQTIQDASSSAIITVPKGTHIDLPGIGMPVPTFKASDTDLQVWYYTTCNFACP